MSNVIVRVINTVGVVVFMLSMIASLSLLTQSNANATPIEQSNTAQHGMVTPYTTLDTRHVDDLRGTTVVRVPVDYIEGPDLYTLGKAGAGDDFYSPRCDCLVAPADTRVSVPGGFYWFDIDGLFFCPENRDEKCRPVANTI